jgi:DNA-binding LytR/AlgR family response regulator
MINCLVIDDEQHAIDVLELYIKQTPYLQLAGSFSRPLEALKIVNEQDIKLVFLDIHMPDITGLDFVRAMNGKCRAIMTTAFSEFAAEGFDLEVVDYLLKPIPLPRFLKAAQRALQIISGQTAQVNNNEGMEDDYMFVKTEMKGKLLKINFADIDYIEGMKNYVAIHHNGQKTLALLNMKDLEERLPSRHFMRIQKSFIVPLRKITGVEGNMIRLKNITADILLGETYRTSFLEKMKGKVME